MYRYVVHDVLSVGGSWRARRAAGVSARRVQGVAIWEGAVPGSSPPAVEPKPGRLGVRVDLSGHVYGSLTVLGLDLGEWSTYRGRKWLCECSCGRRVSVHASNLRSGKTRACGQKSPLHALRPLHIEPGVPDRIVGEIARNPAQEFRDLGPARVPAKTGAKIKDPLGEKRVSVTLAATKSEFKLLRKMLANLRARRYELSILAMLRRSGVGLELDTDGVTVNVSNLADDAGERDEQIAAIRAQKPLIVAALLAERFGGPTYDHSALAGGVLRTYQQAAKCHEAGIAPAACGELVGMLDEYLESMGELEYCTLPDAIALCVQRLPAMAAVIGRINAERAAGMEGVELAKATADAFGVSSRPVPGVQPAAATFDASVLG